MNIVYSLSLRPTAQHKDEIDEYNINIPHNMKSQNTTILCYDVQR